MQSQLRGRKAGGGAGRVARALLGRQRLLKGHGLFTLTLPLDTQRMKGTYLRVQRRLITPKEIVLKLGSTITHPVSEMHTSHCPDEDTSMR